MFETLHGHRHMDLDIEMWGSPSPSVLYAFSTDNTPEGYLMSKFS